MNKLISSIAIATIVIFSACSNSTPETSTASAETAPSTTVANETPEPAKEIAASEAMESDKMETKAMEMKKEMEKAVENKVAEKEKAVVPAKKMEDKTTKNEKAASIAQSPPMEDKKVMEQPKVETPMPPKEEVKPAPAPAKPQKALPNHASWNSLLQKNVSSSGKVNYKGFKAAKGDLQKYLDDLAANTPQSDWTRKETMAYWINAYNAYTVKLIVDNYPVKSITDLEGGKPWDKKWIKLGSKTYSLNNIENDILRPKYKDARIHFAVNCAAKSCPPLLNKAWTAGNLKSNFEKQAKAFINNSSFNSVGAGNVEISKIFEWYAVDFGNIIEYLNKYSTTKINADGKVGYKEYDWALNE